MENNKLKPEEVFNSIFYKKLPKNSKDSSAFLSKLGPKDYVIQANNNHKLFLAYQENENNYIYGSYENIDIFLKTYELMLDERKRFYEIIRGPCHTYADIDWNNGNETENVIRELEKVFSIFYDKLEVGDLIKENILWSNSSKLSICGKSKGSLHFLYNNVNTCWKNNIEQGLFWKSLVEFLYENIAHYPNLFYYNGKEVKCVIDTSVYTKDRQWRIIESHKYGDDRKLRPIELEYTDERPLRDYFVTIDYNIYDYYNAVNIIANNESQDLSEDIKKLIKDKFTDIETIIKEKIPQTKIVNVKGNLVILRNMGVRKCIINGENNYSDNSYCIIKKDGIYFQCHDEKCLKGRPKKIHDFSNIEFNQEVFDNLLKKDFGLSKIFASLARDIIKIVDGKDTCYIWKEENKLWNLVRINRITNIAHTLLYPVINNYIEYFRNKNDKDTIKVLLRIRDYITGEKNVKSIVSAACEYLEDLDFLKKLNKNPDLLPIANNKVVNLQSGEVSERLKEHYFSFTTNVDVDINQEKLEIVDKFILDICNDDIELKSYLQKILGYCLTGHVNERCYFIWYGKGANGKSTLLNLLSNILLEEKFCDALSKEIFIKSKIDKTPGSATPHLEPLTRIRLGIFQESEANEELNESIIKTLSGNDKITYRPLYGSNMTFKPQCKLILATNYKPKFEINNSNLDRLRFIPFLARFEENPKKGNKLRNEQLTKMLETEYLNNVFTWILQGAIRWYKERLYNPPDIVTAKTKNYTESLDDVGKFLKERTQESEDGKIQASVLYKIYSEWCKENGIKAITINAFGRNLKIKNIIKRKELQGMFYLNIEIV